MLETLADRLAAWRLRSRDNFYQVRDRSGAEIIAFHWHPRRRDSPDFPQFHVTSRVGAVEVSRRHHVPTGRVSLEAVVRFLIVELGVALRRDDWEDVLADGERRFAERRTW